MTQDAARMNGETTRIEGSPRIEGPRQDRDALRVKEEARALGFSHVGICSAAPDALSGERLTSWLERGYHASMMWMAARAAERVDPSLVLPGAQSIISLAFNYFTPHAHSGEESAGKVSRYAWGDDYHEVVGDRVRSLAAWLERAYPGERAVWYVDTGPVMEKVWAGRAGIGWIGKHTNVITTDKGSWVFLGEIITTLRLPADEPAADHCGTCTLCIEACPTGAIVEPYVVDSNKCLSYLTIEHRGPVDPVLHDRYEGWVFGCDVCQDVCPWNRKFAAVTSEPRFHPRPGNLDPPLDGWAEMTAAEFAARFAGSPIRRAKHQGLLRNVRIARGDDPAVPGPASHDRRID
jgi:epoxyqueuosine reductase